MKYNNHENELSNGFPRQFSMKLGAIGAQSMPGRVPTIGLLYLDCFFMQKTKQLRLADRVDITSALRLIGSFEKQGEPFRFWCPWEVCGVSWGAHSVPLDRLRIPIASLTGVALETSPTPPHSRDGPWRLT